MTLDFLYVVLTEADATVLVVGENRDACQGFLDSQSEACWMAPYRILNSRLQLAARELIEEAGLL